MDTNGQLFSRRISTGIQQACSRKSMCTNSPGARHQKSFITLRAGHQWTASSHVAENQQGSSVLEQ